MTASKTAKQEDRAEQVEGADRAESGETVDTLVLDLLEWMGSRARPYDEVMEAWRTSCPRLTVWEDATARGYVERRSDPRLGRVVTVTAAGAAHLQRHRPDVPAALGPS